MSKVTRNLDATLLTDFFCVAQRSATNEDALMEEGGAKKKKRMVSPSGCRGNAGLHGGPDAGDGGDGCGGGSARGRGDKRGSGSNKRGRGGGAPASVRTKASSRRGRAGGSQRDCSVARAGAATSGGAGGAPDGRLLVGAAGDDVAGLVGLAQPQSAAQAQGAAGGIVGVFGKEAAKAQKRRKPALLPAAGLLDGFSELRVRCAPHSHLCIL